MDVQQHTDLYVTYLIEKGYTPQVNGDVDVVDVVFEDEQWTYYIAVDNNDPEYFRLVSPGFWPIDSPAERARAYIVADRINRTCKGVNAYLEAKGDNVSAAVEGFFDPPEGFRPMFNRMLHNLRYVCRKFREEMREG